MPSSSDEPPSSDEEAATQYSDADEQPTSETSSWQGRTAQSAHLETRRDCTREQQPRSQSRQLVNKPDYLVVAGRERPGTSASGKRKARPETSSDPKSQNSQTSQSTWENMKHLLSNNYRNLLNNDIEEVSGALEKNSTNPLASSQISGSVWSPREKDALLHRLAIRGRHDLHSLTQAVPTKNELEIRMYIRQLQQDTHNSANVLPFADIPAAFEVSPECERILEMSADALEMFGDQHETQLEQRLFTDDYWLIDEEQAAQLEYQLDACEPLSHEAQHEQDSQYDEPHVGDPSTSHNISPPSILRPASLLELSRNLFMNHGNDRDLNWQHLSTSSAASNEPSMFRSAFEQLHELMISVTRRLVHAAIIQARSRLRAQELSRNDWNPAATIRSIDVKAASDILELPSWNDYWLGVARRCQVNVYSNSRKYADGRPRVKSGITGRLLTYDEVDAELRGKDNRPASPIPNDGEVDEEEIDATMLEEHLFTSDSELSDGPEEQHALTSGNRRSENHSKKRKRSASAAEFYHTEQRYLEVLDHNTSVHAEQTLWAQLGRLPGNASRPLLPMPSPPGPLPDLERPKELWTAKVDYYPPWEHVYGPPAEATFQAVGQRGHLAKKRRIVVMQKVAQRLQSGSGLARSQDHSSDKSVLAESELASEDETDNSNSLNQGSHDVSEHSDTDQPALEESSAARLANERSGSMGSEDDGRTHQSGHDNRLEILNDDLGDIPGSDTEMRVSSSDDDDDNDDEEQEVS